MLSHGAHEKADTFFKKKWNCLISNMSGKVVFTYLECVFTLSEMYGDCTACTLYTGQSSLLTFSKILPMIIEYLSIQGRISCMITRHVHMKDIPEELELLKKFNVLGLHVQYSNRSDKKETVQVSGILKITNPFVKGQYSAHREDVAKLTHDHLENSEFMELNKQFGLLC